MIKMHSDQECQLVSPHRHYTQDFMSVTCAAAWGPVALHLLECSMVPILKFLIIFYKPRSLHFHFALGPSNNIAGSD